MSSENLDWLNTKWDEEIKRVHDTYGTTLNGLLLNHWEIAELIYLRLATLTYPQDVFCGWCGSLNNFADDCGFFYVCGNPDDAKDGRPCCKECYFGERGKLHKQRYGVGER